MDSGASVNIFEFATFQRLRDKPPLQSSPTRVYPYGSDTPLPVIGTANRDADSIFGVYLLTLVAAKTYSWSFERDCTKSAVTVLAA